MPRPLIRWTWLVILLGALAVAAAKAWEGMFG